MLFDDLLCLSIICPLITFDEQNAGKTTHLSKLVQWDITIDSQKYVHVPVPINLFLRNSPPVDTSHAVDRSVYQQIYEPQNGEMRCILQRLNRKTNFITFQRKIKQIARETGRRWDSLLIPIVEEFTRLNDISITSSNTMDVFQKEAIFKGGGLKHAKDQLIRLAKDEKQSHVALAWGNTNTVCNYMPSF